MTGSFALSIIMILSFSVLVQWVNMALTPLKPWAPDVFYSSPDNLCEIEKSFVNQVENQPYVKRALRCIEDLFRQNMKGNQDRLI